MGLKTRRRQPELMDQPELDSVSHCHALNGLNRVNRWSGTAGRIWTHVKALSAQRRLRNLKILDLACGGGDVAISLANRAADDGLELSIQGWDRSITATTYANNRAAKRGLENVTFLQRDVLADPISEQFDVVICTLFLHHLSATDAATLLKRMHDASRRIVLVDDLLRTRVGYWLAWVGTRILSRSPIVHFDGPASVEAAYCVEEVRELADRAGLTDAHIERHWPQRFLLSWHQG